MLSGMEFCLEDRTEAIQTDFEYAYSYDKGNDLNTVFVLPRHFHAQFRFTWHSKYLYSKQD